MNADEVAYLEKLNDGMTVLADIIETTNVVLNGIIDQKDVVMIHGLAAKALLYSHQRSRELKPISENMERLFKLIASS